MILALQRIFFSVETRPVVFYSLITPISQILASEQLQYFLFLAHHVFSFFLLFFIFSCSVVYKSLTRTSIAFHSLTVIKLRISNKNRQASYVFLVVANFYFRGRIHFWLAALPTISLLLVPEHWIHPLYLNSTSVLYALLFYHSFFFIILLERLNVLSFERNVRIRTPLGITQEIRGKNLTPGNCVRYQRSNLGREKKI